MIDFDALFQTFAAAYVRKNPQIKPEEMEALAPDIYELWLETPNQALGGKAPIDYYREENEEALAAEADAYLTADKDIPDALAAAILERPAATEQLMLERLGQPLPEKRLLKCIDLLMEMQSPKAMNVFFALALREEESVVADAATEALMAMGEPAALRALQEMEGAMPLVQDRMADIVSEAALPQAFDAMVRLFAARQDAVPFYATCLAKLGDERALPILEEKLRDPALSYYVFQAVRDAHERLGGWVDVEREFSGDRDYEYIKDLPEED